MRNLTGNGYYGNHANIVKTLAESDLTFDSDQSHMIEAVK